MNNIYQLNVYTFCTKRYHYKTAAFNFKRMWFDTTTKDIGLFDTVEAAERQIKLYLEQEGNLSADWSDIKRGLLIGFTLYERPVNDMLQKPEGNSSYCSTDICHFTSVRTYLADGTLHCCFNYDDACNTEFFGVEDCDVKFKIDDHVLIVYGECAEVMVVDSPVPSKKWWKEHIISGHGGDYSDCSYRLIRYKSGHTHVESYMVFPFVYPKTFAKHIDKVKTELNRYCDEYRAWEAAENEKWLKEHSKEQC